MQRKLFFVFGLCLLPMLAWSSNLALIDDADWYVHANLLEMRQTVAGREIYGWVEREILREIEDELGVSLREELDAVTVFGAGHGHRNASVVLHGFLSAHTRETVLARVQQEVTVTTELVDGRTVYQMTDDNNSDRFWVVFGDSGQALVSGSRTVVDRFVSSGAHLVPDASTALLVIEAEHPLIQGGLDASSSASHGGPWESQMFQNVRQVALLLADDNGLLAFNADVVATSPATAQAVSNIIQGIISLHAMTNEAPEAAAWLDKLQTRTEGDRVTMSLSIEPAALMKVLD